METADGISFNPPYHFCRKRLHVQRLGLHLLQFCDLIFNTTDVYNGHKTFFFNSLSNL